MKDWIDTGLQEKRAALHTLTSIQSIPTFLPTKRAILNYLSMVANTDAILEALGPVASVLKPAARGSMHFMTLLISESVGSFACKPRSVSASPHGRTCERGSMFAV